MTKKDMTEIAQVLANGVVRVYMGSPAQAGIDPRGGGCGWHRAAAQHAALEGLQVVGQQAFGFLKRDALLEVMARMNRGQVLQPASPALEP